jgi:hypothetical protein
VTKKGDTRSDLKECRCGMTASISEDDRSPVKFSEEKGAYTLEWLSNAEIPNSLVIRFCPFCGGQVPPSQRTSLFMAIPPAETVRLNELLKDVLSREDALTVLGKPDSDDSNSFAIHTPVKTGQLSHTTYPRVLTYSKLSEFAKVRIIEDPASGLKVFYEGKPREKASK